MILFVLPLLLMLRSHAFISRLASPRLRSLHMVGTESSSKKGKKEESKYSKTVLLPVTSFDQRANSLKREPEIQKFWETHGVYEKLVTQNSGEKFILHDGPPYANGNLHIGHALNKVLKDFINKYQLLKGRKARYVPGWDCHGLPIELKVLQELKSSEREQLTPLALRKKAAEYAKEAVEIQRKSFKRYGVWGDWDKPYMSLQPEYEAAQIRVFGDMMLKGHIYRGKKPVYWSPSSRTALAEVEIIIHVLSDTQYSKAELEYPENHISRSIYVAFEIKQPSSALSKLLASSGGRGRVAVWTTTPWTIPSNLAVAVNAEVEYAVVSHPKVLNGEKLIVAKDLVKTLSEKFGLVVKEGEELRVEGTLSGAELADTTYQHPLYDRVSKVVIGGDYITTESGTGLVHTAPGHGQDDYQTGMKYGLPLLSPVNDMGCYTEEAGDKLKGLSVLKEGNEVVVQLLTEGNVLLKEEAYNHKYPYDWRTKKPTIVRATEQWFASVSTFREDAMKAIDSVQWVPPVGRNRIASMTETRGDWCISRQRAWGVPIPVFYNKNTNEPLITPETIAHIENVFRERGSDAWWELETAELLPPSFRDRADEYSRGTDTMDVWFDSGSSWAGVMRVRDELQYPADIYLEGSDQHRGWFQSSLLTSVASQGIAPYKTVITHGFVLDEKGYKMSKSLGNVVDPLTIIEGGSNQKTQPAYGADTLRLFISSVDYSDDVCIGENVIKQCSDSYRKLRNTLRYLVGSLNDFNPATDSVPYEKLFSIDKYILSVLSDTVREVEGAFDSYSFFGVNQALFRLSNSDLSSFYLDIAKDRLYITSKNDIRRRSCQTVLHKLLEQMAVVMAPIVPHMAEDVWQNLPYERPTSSVFEKGWIRDEDIFPTHERELWSRIRQLRNDVNKCIESARQNKEVRERNEIKCK